MKIFIIEEYHHNDHANVMVCLSKEKAKEYCDEHYHPTPNGEFWSARPDGKWASYFIEEYETVE